MLVEKTPLEGALLIKPDVRRDQRGFFVETWQKERYAAAGLDLPFVQDNCSSSARGVLRGLHFQRRHPQGKLVFVSLGEVYDVIVDIRRGSPTFGQWHAARLSAENQHQLWAPPGMAHGFAVVSPMACFHYKCTEFYRPDDEESLLWNDPDLGVVWPDMPYILSPKDQKATCWKDLINDFNEE